MQFVRVPLVQRFWRVETHPGCELAPDEHKFRLRLTFLLAALITVAGFWMGVQGYVKHQDRAWFYQTYFSPAVTLYCTGEFRRAEPTEALQEFLAPGEADDDLCRDIRPTSAWDSFDRDTSYLYLLSALCWKLLGLSWTSMWPVAGLLTAAFSLATFCFTRAFTSSAAVSAILALAVLGAEPVQDQIPNLRDFSKAPFVVGSLALLALVVCRHASRRQTFGLAFAAGSIAALGRGFRPDIMVVFPIVLLCPLLMIWSDKARTVLQRIGMTWGGFFLGYLALGILYWLIAGPPGSTGSLIGHFFLQGFAPYYQVTLLGMAPAPYAVTSLLYDGFIMSKVNLFSGFGDWTLVLHRPEYGQAAMRLLIHTLLTVPHDAFMRVFYAANVIGHLPINRVIWGLPLLILTPILFAFRPRALLFLIASFAMLVAPQSLLAHPRHGFFLIVFGAAFVGFSLFTLYRLVAHLAKEGLRPLPIVRFRLGAFVVVFAAIAVLVGGTSAALSYWQERNLRSIAATYQKLEWEPVGYETSQPNAVRQTAPGTETSIALERIDFDVRPISDAPLITSTLPWKSVQGASLKATPAGFLLNTKRAGYAAESRLDTKFFGPPGKDGQRILDIQLAGRTREGTYNLGILSGDRKRWLIHDQLPSGEWTYVRNIKIPADMDSVFIVFEKRGVGIGSIELHSAEVRKIGPDDCYVGQFSVQQTYTYVSKQIRTEGMEIHNRGKPTSLYFTPLQNGFALDFETLELSELPASCVSGWSIAKNFPSGTVPMEMVTQGGQLTDFSWGNWTTVWRDFID